MFDYLNELAAETEPATLTWLLFANGEPEAHNNVLLFGFPAGQGEPARVAKICRAPAYSQTIRNEYERLNELWRILGRDAAGLAPRPLALGRRGADLALLMSYCPGRQLLPKPASFWQDEAQVQELWRQAASWLRAIHRRTAAASPPPSVQPDFGAMADAFGNFFPLTPQEEKELAVLRETVAGAGADTAVLLQGDFWPGNVILRSGDAAFTLVDWQFSRWSGNASLDVYLFPLVCGVKAAPYSPPAERGAAAARILAKWQTTLLPSYLRHYGDVSGYTVLPPRAGMLAVCVEMAVRPYLTFGIWQEDALLWRALFTELSDCL